MIQGTEKESEGARRDEIKNLIFSDSVQEGGWGYERSLFFIRRTPNPSYTPRPGENLVLVLTVLAGIVSLLLLLRGSAGFLMRVRGVHDELLSDAQQVHLKPDFVDG